MLPGWGWQFCTPHSQFHTNLPWEEKEKGRGAVKRRKTWVFMHSENKLDLHQQPAKKGIYGTHLLICYVACFSFLKTSNSKWATNNKVDLICVICLAPKAKFLCKAHGFRLGARTVRNTGEQKEIDLFSMYAWGQPKMHLDKKNPNDYPQRHWIIPSFTLHQYGVLLEWFFPSTPLWLRPYLSTASSSGAPIIKRIWIC